MPESVDYVDKDKVTYSVSDIFSDEEVKEMIRLRYEDKYTYTQLADKFECHRNTIQNIFSRLDN